MQLIAHRGFAAHHPENTIAAVRAAATTADAIEIDVRRCGSGELVVIHDATVDRVTDGSGRVADLGLEELQGFSVLDSDQSIPTLSEVIVSLPPGVGLNVELKEEGVAPDAVTAIEPVRDAWISSFIPEALVEARSVSEAVSLAYLWQPDEDESVQDGTERGTENVSDPIQRALELDCAGIHPRHDSCTTGDLVARAHDAGLVVNAWTVETRERATRLERAGVDGVIADRSDVLEDVESAPSE